jgi:hypothetical protein
VGSVLFASEYRRVRSSVFYHLTESLFASAIIATISLTTARRAAGLASADLMAALRLEGRLHFSDIVARLLQTYMLRETNVKDICVRLVKAGKIENTWARAIASHALKASS